MDAAIEAYLPGTRFEDFGVEIRGEVYNLPGVNSLAWSDLFRLYQEAKKSSIGFLSFGFLLEGKGIPEDFLYNLSEPQLEELVEQWFRAGGCLPQNVGQITYVIEKGSQEFNYDLRRILGMKNGLAEFLTLPLVDCVDIMEMMVHNETSAWIWALLNEYKFPLPREAIVSADVVFTTGYKVPQSYSRLVRSSDILDLDALETAQELADKYATPPTPEE